ncbi:MAG: hypothetical protein VZS44_11310 [Bacilli bacterium]|nr:hypothetical protein [Bacilli bacterium]
MKFITKMSGVRVEDYDIIPIFDTQYIDLKSILYKVTRQETMDWILDKLRFTKGTDNNWYTTVDWDTIYKLSVLENYPEYEKEFIDYFGENWINHYIRFNH